jgi:hypothetical protein
MVPNRQTVEASVHVVRARKDDNGNRGFNICAPPNAVLGRLVHGPLCFLDSPKGG